MTIESDDEGQMDSNVDFVSDFKWGQKKKTTRMDEEEKKEDPPNSRTKDFQKSKSIED